jgi:enterochelin esterase-like enzyme
VTSSPALDGSSVTFELLDRYGRLAAVRLVQEIGLPGPLDLVRRAGRWQLRIPVPDVDRMEYLFEVEDHNGNRTTTTDPANTRRAPGAFGDKSVVEFADYRPPVWLTAEPVPGTEVEVPVEAPELDAILYATIWTPSVLDDAEPAPLLVVHDGPEYASLGGLTHYLGVSIATGALPPLRAALLGPGDRNEWYSANPRYAQTMCAQVLDALGSVASATERIGVGVSLGALAMLHAHRTHPDMFDGLMLQSGSFFTPDLDAQESGFSGFAAVTDFVAGVHAATTDQNPVRTVLTCGTLEENLANNVAMTASLQRLGYRAELVRTRDTHNYTGWRDTLDPHLTGLIRHVVGARAS